MKNICAILIITLSAAVSLSLWAQAPNSGEEVFKTRCAACHGSKGEGAIGGKIPAIKGTPMTVDKIVALLTKGQGGKTVHATRIVNIDDVQAKAVAEYVKTLK